MLILNTDQRPFQKDLNFNWNHFKPPPKIPQITIKRHKKANDRNKDWVYASFNAQIHARIFYTRKRNLFAPLKLEVYLELLHLILSKNHCNISTNDSLKIFIHSSIYLYLSVVDMGGFECMMKEEMVKSAHLCGKMLAFW